MLENQSVSQRFAYLDALKGIAIILVVVAHMLGEGEFKFIYSPEIRKFIYTFHMPLFFILCGISFSISFNKGKATLKKSIYKVLLPYLLWSSIYLLLTSLSTKIDIKEWLIAIFTLRGRAPLWFLGSLFICQILFILIESPRKILAIVIISILLSLTGYYLGIKNNISLSDKYLQISIYRTSSYIIFFYIGWLLNKHKDFINKNIELYIISFIILCFSTYFISPPSVNLHLFNLGSNIFSFFYISITYSITIILFFIFLNNFFRYSLLSYIGKYSMGIMIFHYTPFQTMKYSKFLSEILFTKNELIFIFGLILCIFISIISTLLVNKKLML